MKQDKSCGCVIVKNGKVLLIGARDNDGTMYWGFPKGHQEGGETNVETALRETKEETGLDVKIIDDEPVVAEYLIHDNTVLKYVYLFLAKPLSKKIVLQEEEVEKAEWVPIKKVKGKISSHFEKAWQEILKKKIIRRNKNKTGRNVFGVVLLALVAAIAVATVLNRVVIYDFVRGLSYQPSEEMANIKKSLQLTDLGEFIFNASQPELNKQDEFNRNCYAINDDAAVLGCYVNQNIYVYDITEKSLDGIRELTTAHELLHAIYARLSQDEKINLKPVLEKVYDDNVDILKSDLEIYLESERLEEIYVRAGTEIKKLPDELEEHYTRVFKDQDAVVDFYDQYIGVFREVETKLDNLTKEMDVIKTVMDEKTIDYENRTADLTARINEFNNCADTAGCFESSWEFYMQRNQLMMERESLMVLYNEISDLMDRYNAKVDEYNNNVIKSNKLNQIINSNQKIESIE